MSLSPLPEYTSTLTKNDLIVKAIIINRELARELPFQQRFPCFVCGVGHLEYLHFGYETIGYFSCRNCENVFRIRNELKKQYNIITTSNFLKGIKNEQLQKIRKKLIKFSVKEIFEKLQPIKFNQKEKVSSLEISPCCKDKFKRICFKTLSRKQKNKSGKTHYIICNKCHKIYQYPKCNFHDKVFYISSKIDKLKEEINQLPMVINNG